MGGILIMQEVVIAAAVRTAVGKIGGTLKNIQPEKLLAAVFTGAVQRAGIDAAVIDEVIAGQAKQSTDAPNIARVAALMARIPEQVPAYTVHRQCASGMQALYSAAEAILCGDCEIVLTGGVESMSTAPFYIRNARFGVGNGNAGFIDPNIESQPKSQPNDIYGTFNMIQTADNVAKVFGISRGECDAFAYESQRKAIHAIDSGLFEREIVPVLIPQRKKEAVVFATDEFPKRDTSLEKLAQLKPINEGGVTTAGNASGRNDGASAILLMSAAKAAELGVRPLARIIGFAAAGVDPKLMGIGPVAAVKKLFKKINMTIEDFDLYEINEAFAAQSVACAKELQMDMAKLNVNGGAIALGHPLGCSGSRIVGTLAYELQRRKGKYGLASICIAGGLGMAVAIENMEA